MNTEQKVRVPTEQKFRLLLQHEGDVVASLEPAASRLSRRRRFAALEPRPGYAACAALRTAPACTVQASVNPGKARLWVPSPPLKDRGAAGGCATLEVKPCNLFRAPHPASPSPRPPAPPQDAAP
jgi:hypothetical protein